MSKVKESESMINYSFTLNKTESDHLMDIIIQGEINVCLEKSNNIEVVHSNRIWYKGMAEWVQEIKLKMLQGRTEG